MTAAEERCQRCDRIGCRRVQAWRDDSCGFPDCSHDPCGACDILLECQAHAVDWRARALAAEDRATKAEVAAEAAGRKWPQTARALVEALSTFPLGRIWLRELEEATDRVDEARKERDEPRDWVRRITSEQRTLTCVYCGHAYPPGTPAHGSEVLTAHIAVCEKHPMTAIRSELASERALADRLAEALREVQSAHDHLSHHAECNAQAHRDGECECQQSAKDNAPCPDNPCTCCLSVDVIAPALAAFAEARK